MSREEARYKFSSTAPNLLKEYEAQCLSLIDFREKGRANNKIKQIIRLYYGCD